MRAILVATGWHSDPDGYGPFRPPCLLPLVDRPFLQHVVERLVSGGAREIDLIVSHRPELVRAVLGTGERWGVTLRYHLARRPGQPYDRVRGLASGVTVEPVLLAHADRLVLEFGLPQPGSSPVGVVALCSRADRDVDGHHELEWTGWSWLGAGALAELPPDADRGELEAWILSRAQDSGLVAIVPMPLSLGPPLGLLGAQRRVLDGDVPVLLGPETEREPGLWISPRASVHPSARLAPPVFVGEQCRIGPGVRLGPNVAVGAGSIVDRGATLADAVVLPGSFVGRALTLRDAVVGGGHVLSLRLGTSVVIDDPALLSGLSAGELLGGLRAAASRGFAGLLLVIAAPVIGLTAAWLWLTRPGKVLHSWQAVRQPTAVDPRSWLTCEVPSLAWEGPGPSAGASVAEDLLLRVLPGLLAVARGDLALVGLTVRAPSELLALPLQWRELFLGAGAGLVSASLVSSVPHPTLDDLLAAEAMQAVKPSAWQDLTLPLRYLGAALSGRRVPTGWPAPLADPADDDA